MLEERAMLVNVTVRTWTGVVTDRLASEEVARAKKADTSRVRLKKNLVGEALRAVQRAAQAIRQYVRENTLPWYDGNWRILPAEHFFEFSQGLRKKIDEFSEAVRKFIEIYPAQVEAARTFLGDLYRECEFLPPDRIRNAFTSEVDFMPLPRGKDFRVDLVNGAMEEIRRRVEERYRESFARIKEDILERIAELASRIERCLRGDRKVVTSALIRDIQQAPRVLRRLNVIDDPEVEELIQHLEKLTPYDREAAARNNLVQGLFLSTARSLMARIASMRASTGQSAAPTPRDDCQNTPQEVKHEALRAV